MTIPPEEIAATTQEKRFCTVCGLWFGEFMACEEVDCRLENDAEVAKRLERAKEQS